MVVGNGPFMDSASCSGGDIGHHTYASYNFGQMIQLTDALAFTEWTHSLQNPYIFSPTDSKWHSITDEVLITTEELYDIYLQELQKQ